MAVLLLLLEMRDLIMRMAFCRSLSSVKRVDCPIRLFASSMFFTMMPVANTCGTLLPRLTYPASSNAAMAVRTRVSTSAISSFQPACLAISKAEQHTCFLCFVKSLIAFQTCCISLRLNLVWLSRIKCLSKSWSL